MLLSYLLFCLFYCISNLFLLSFFPSFFFSFSPFFLPSSFIPSFFLLQYSLQGASFAEVCKATSVFEGSIVRCLRRVDELLLQLSEAAKQMGSEELNKKFQQCSEHIRRDIVFAASLYINQEEDANDESASSALDTAPNAAAQITVSNTEASSSSSA